MTDHNEILERYRLWVYSVATDMLWESSSARRALDRDDLAQEGLVAMWRALQTFDPERGHEAAHLTNAARKRMLDMVSGRKPTFGTEGNRGRWRIPERQLTHLVRTNPDTGTEFYAFEPEEPCVEDMLMVYLERAA